MEERSPSSAVSCNRKPFVSDQSCDRGSVDTNMFSDLPYCETISPTMPEIPPEIVDPEIVIPVPPPCACVNIDYKFNFGGYKSGFSAKSEFKAKGDCCEGSYDTNFDFEFPCPINNFGSKKFKATIDWDKQQVHEQTYIEPKSECGIEPKDISFTIGLPCPIRGMKSEIGISIDWDHPRRGTAVLANSGGRKCGIDLLEGSIDIGLPCPIVGGSATINVNMGWDSPASGTADVARKSGGCAIELESGTLNIGLPCPITGTRSKMDLDLGWDQPNYGSALLAKKGGVGCGLEMREESLHLGLPCPVSGVDASVAVNIGWDEPRRDKKTVIKQSGECSLSAESADLTIGLPCPINGSGNAKIEIGYGRNFKGEERQIAHRSGDCGLEFDNPTFELKIPCPLDKLTLKGAVVASSNWGISVEQSSGGSACSKTFTMKLKVPESIINTEVTCMDVISELEFEFPNFKYRTQRICGQFKIDLSSLHTMNLPTTKHSVKCSNDTD